MPKETEEVIIINGTIVPKCITILMKYIQRDNPNMNNEEAYQEANKRIDQLSTLIIKLMD